MIKAFQNTWHCLLPKEKTNFFWLLVMDIAISVADILCMIILLWVVSFYISPENTFHNEWLPDKWFYKGSLVPITICLLGFAIKNMAAYLSTKAFYRFMGRVAVRISSDNLTNYQRGSFNDFVETDSSKFIRKIGFLPFEFAQYMLAGLQQFITQAVLIIATVSVILVYNAQVFFLLLLFLIPPALFVFYYIRKKMSHARIAIKESNETSFQYLLDAIKGWVEGNIYNRNHFFRNRFIRERKIFSTALFSSLSWQSLPGRVIELFAVAGLFLLIAIMSVTGNNSQQTLFMLGAFMAASYKIIPGLVKLINIVGQMKTYSGTVADINNQYISAGIARDTVIESIESLSFNEVSFAYNGRIVLNNFDLLIQKGDFIGITGESGRGKTTIINLLLGFLSPDRGCIKFNGREMTPTEIKKYWPEFAYVRQQSFLLHDSLHQNIVLDEAIVSQNRVDSVVEKAGLHSYVAQYPEGVLKTITENGKNISGGQQQRIAIARALYKNASVLLLDEPFNELDEDATKDLLNEFRKMASQGKMILMITHDHKSLSYCNKTISLNAFQN